MSNAPADKKIGLFTNVKTESEADYQASVAKIDQQLAEHGLLLYMKGEPADPMCGFSAKAVKLLQQCGVENIASVDILDPKNQGIRNAIKEYKKWPTFPQLYINGKLVGGVDIMQELYDDGELQTLVQEFT